MKKALYILLSILSIISITACGTGEPAGNAAVTNDKTSRDTTGGNNQPEDLYPVADALQYVAEWRKVQSQRFGGKQAFVIKKSDLGPILNDTTDGIILYLGYAQDTMQNGNDTLRMFWQSYYDSIPNPGDTFHVATYIELNGQVYVLDHTGPCPTCQLVNGLDHINAIRR